MILCICVSLQLLKAVYRDRDSTFLNTVTFVVHKEYSSASDYCLRFIMPKDYGSWSLANLKAELRKRNAKVTGRKAILVQRLMDYDVMFGGLVNDPESSYQISIPGPEHFLDINSNTVLPKITLADIQQYAILGERENLVSSENMYNEYYLLSSRVAQPSNHVFVTAVCAAEMRKNVTYSVTIHIEDTTIVEAQCECAAGMGSYAQCKHVLVLMFGLVDFTTNKTIKIRVSPTSNLQTFHQPTRMHTGEPVMAENLKLKLHDDVIKQITTFDPRTNVENKEKYTEMFINLTANFAASQKSSMPIQQLLKPANKIVVFKDHDYLENTMEKEYIDSLRLTEEQRKELEKNTRVNKKMWKHERQMRLQSSNFGKICKCVTTKEKLAKSFLKNQEVLTLATKHGMKYEKEALRKLSHIIGVEVKKCGLFVHEEHQFLASTPDGICDEHGTVEVKCPYSAKNKKISTDTVPYLYLCDRTGQLKLDEKHDYYYQIQGQLLCTGRMYCYFGVYTICELCVIKIERNDNFIKEMLTKLTQFYNDHYKYQFLCKYLYNIKGCH